MSVRAGAPKPDIGSVEAFKQTLLRAKSITFPGSTTGRPPPEVSFCSRFLTMSDECAPLPVPRVTFERGWLLPPPLDLRCAASSSLLIVALITSAQLVYWSPLASSRSSASCSTLIV